MRTISIKLLIFLFSTLLCTSHVRGSASPTGNSFIPLNTFVGVRLPEGCSSVLVPIIRNSYYTRNDHKPLSYQDIHMPQKSSKITHAQYLTIQTLIDEIKTILNELEQRKQTLRNLITKPEFWAEMKLNRTALEKVQAAITAYNKAITLLAEFTKPVMDETGQSTPCSPLKRNFAVSWE